MIYQFRCLECDHITDINRPLASRNDPLACEECGSDMKRVITGGQGFNAILGGADQPGYMCPVTDQWVDSKKKRREIMARHDLVEAPSADGKGVHI